MTHNHLIKKLLPGFPAFACAMALVFPASVFAAASAPDAANDKPATAETAKVPAAEATVENPNFGEYLSGRFAESLGDTQNGIHFLRDSLKHSPGNKEMQASLFRMLMLSGKIDEALVLAPQLQGTRVVEDGSEFSPEMLLALEEARKGQYPLAVQHLETLPKAGFNNLLVPLLEAWISLGQNQVKKPVEAKDLMPDSHLILPHVYLNAAFINDIAGFDDMARKQYEEAVKDVRIEPFRAVEALANYYDRKGLTDKRKKLVTDYFAAHGDSFLANELLMKPAGAHPAPLVNNVTEGLAEVFYTTANIFHGVRAPADEVVTLHMALFLRPHFPAAQFLMANAYELAEDYASAIDAYKKIESDSPYYMRGRVRSVYDESEMGKADGALAHLDEIIEQDPKNVDALLAKGDILRTHKNLHKAVEVYTEALGHVDTSQKQHWVIYFSRGACYEELGEWDKSEADMKKALQLSPGEADVLNYLGYGWLTRHQNLAEARKMIEQAYEARPEDAHIIDSMGYAFYVSGDFPAAQEYFEQALERTPNDATVNDHLGDNYWQLGRKVEARFQWQRALNDSPDAQTERDLRQKIEKGLAMIPPQQAKHQEKKPLQEPTADE